MNKVQYSEYWPWMLEITNNNSWRVVNYKTGKKYGTYPTFEQADKKRLRLMEASNQLEEKYNA
jgi:hypothetical protein